MLFGFHTDVSVDINVMFPPLFSQYYCRPNRPEGLRAGAAWSFLRVALPGSAVKIELAQWNLEQSKAFFLIIFTC